PMSRVRVLPAVKAVDEEAATVTSKAADKSWIPKLVEARAPVDGLKVSLVLVTFWAWLPEAVVTQVGYIVALVVVSSVMAVVVALVAVEASVQEVIPLPLVERTNPLVPLVAGRVMVQVPAAAATVRPTVPLVVPARLRIPVLVPARPRVWAAVKVWARFKRGTVPPAALGKV